MKLYYISKYTLSSNCVDSAQIVRLCQTLAQQNTYERKIKSVTLFIGGSRKNVLSILKNQKNLFSLVIMPQFSFLPFFRYLAVMLAKLYYLARAGRPDTYYSDDVMLLALLSAGRIPLYYEASALPVTTKEKWAVRTLLKSKALRGIIFQSEELKTQWLKAYPHYDRSHCLVAYNAALISHKGGTGAHASADIGYHIEDDAENARDFIQIIAERLPEMNFHIFMQHQLRLKYQKYYSHVANIQLHTYASYHQWTACLNMVDIMIHPSFNEYGDLQYLVEYMARGKVILAADTTPIKEVLTTGENAGLLPAQQTGAWVDALCYITKEKTFAAALANKAHKDAEQYYTFPIRAQYILDFIEATKNKPRHDEA